MITLKEIDNNIFELKVTIFGFTGSLTNLWYWDLDKKLISERREFPDNFLTRQLTQLQLDRFEKHYKPLIIKRNKNK